jgi:hypothetical protein
MLERTGERALCSSLHRLRAIFLTAMGADEAQIDASFCCTSSNPAKNAVVRSPQFNLFSATSRAAGAASARRHKADTAAKCWLASSA